jgi:hypothetical protein
MADPVSLTPDEQAAGIAALTVYAANYHGMFESTVRSKLAEQGPALIDAVGAAIKGQVLANQPQPGDPNAPAPQSS